MKYIKHKLSSIVGQFFCAVSFLQPSELSEQTHSLLLPVLCSLITKDMHNGCKSHFSWQYSSRSDLFNEGGSMYIKPPNSKPTQSPPDTVLR